MSKFVQKFNAFVVTSINGWFNVILCLMLKWRLITTGGFMLLLVATFFNRWFNVTFCGDFY